MPDQPKVPIELVKTEPLTVKELVDWFEISPRRIGSFLKSIGSEKIGRRWRVPLQEMPPGYLLKAGMIEW